MKMWIARISDDTLELFKIKPKSFYEEGADNIGQGEWIVFKSRFFPRSNLRE